MVAWVDYGPNFKKKGKQDQRGAREPCADTKKGDYVRRGGCALTAERLGIKPWNGGSRTEELKMSKSSWQDDDYPSDISPPKVTNSHRVTGERNLAKALDRSGWRMTSSKGRNMSL